MKGRRPGGLAWYLARRYLASRRQGRLLSFITAIALGGVIVGVTALIVVTGVMTGMQTELKEKILATNAHIVVLQAGTNLRLHNWEEVLDSIRAVEGVRAASPVVFSNVGIQRNSYARTANLVGILTDTTGVATTSLEASILDGVLSLDPPESGLPPILLGVGVAEVMNLFPGDTVSIIAFENLTPDPLTGAPIPRTIPFEVTGSFATGMYDADNATVYVRLEDAQRLLSLDPSTASVIGIQVTDLDASDAMAERLNERLGLRYQAQSWSVRNAALFSALKLEKLAMGLILFLIVLVAAFNIVSTLVLVVADRTREIGILKSMGMTDRGILRVFVLQGAWIGIVGAFVGTVLGVGLGWMIDTFEIIRIPPDIYFVERLPVEIDPLDVLLVFLASVAVAFLATIYPARQAARLQPVEAIRHE
ncbi:MAG: ABC transporter permease [Longimicrobiales bacterium]|nr:ABC transporter permease [Longimicrobiales bacterium]